MSKQISIPDDLYQRLSAQAHTDRQPVDSLVVTLLEEAMAGSSVHELVMEFTRAYAEGRSLTVTGNWSRIEEELAANPSPFPSLEAAMDRARGRG